MKSRLLLPLIAAILVTTPALASSEAAWAALDKASAKACLHATGFLNATVSPPTRFSDGIGYDIRIVSGTYPQKHMKGTRGQML